MPKVNFYDRAKIAALFILQIFVFYFWQTSIVKTGITVFNLLGSSSVWILPLGILVFTFVDMILVVFFFNKNYFLKTFLFLFNFFLLILELIIVGYYLITV